MRYRGTYITVNLEAIRHNLREIRKLLPENVRILAVVKADAYGHGAVPVSCAALEAGADMLAVAIPEEGVELRRAGVQAPVLVLGPTTRRDAEACVEYGLTMTVCDAQEVAWIEHACVSAERSAQAHLKLDTGMGRIGARTPEQVQQVLDAIRNAPHVTLSGVYTHFADADGDDASYSKMQMARFDTLCRGLPEHLLRHAAASAAMLRFPEGRYDMVRAGIILYGCPAWQESRLSLEPAMTWKAEVTYVKWIEPGECVSYGCTFRAERLTQVATLAVGYADGYHRALSGRGYVLLHGRRCPILGRVCMDQTMVDVTGVPDVKPGDEAVLMGRDGDAELSADELAAMCDTISYEMLLAHGKRVPVEYE